MKEFSKKELLEEWDYWTREDPNNDMNKGGYSVFCCNNYNNRIPPDRNYAEVESIERIFKTKEESWLYFEDSIGEYGISGRDFWVSIWWDDKGVFTIHYDEVGIAREWIEKWEGFDDDIQISWKYNGVKYKTYKDLLEAEPRFNGCYMSTDKPWIRYKGDPEGNDMAHLDITLSESFEKSCKEKEKELKDNKKKWKEEREEREESFAREGKSANFDDLPF